MQQNTNSIDLNKNTDRSWEKVIMKYNRPDLVKSIWQICNSVIPYLAVVYLMYRSLQYSYIYTLLLAVLASGFMIRMFIIFHDCGHRSFFKSKKANTIVGMMMGLFSATPYYHWHNSHRIHHATSGNLDKRGIGDVWTMTVDEYNKSSAKDRFIYRFFRNPFVMFLLGPILVILVQNRFSRKNMSKQEKLNLYFTNIAFLTISILVSIAIGLKAFLMIQLPILLIGHSLGIWLFYIQHQFDGVVWERQAKWDYRLAALKGSSFLKLPAVFQWFTGNIGFHHVHHLSSMIPNYNLPKCHYENEIFNTVPPVTFASTFGALSYGLWDEAKHKMVSFRSLSLAKSAAQRFPDSNRMRVNT